MATDLFSFSPLLNYLVIPLLICLSRIVDVSIGTIRIVYVSRGMKALSAGLGFCEVLIWLFAIGQIMQNLTNFVNYVAYAAGFAIGNYCGIYIEEKLSLGYLMLRIFVKKEPDILREYLNAAGYGVTTVKANGVSGPVDVLFAIIRRRDYKDIIQIINNFNPKALYTVEEVKSINKSEIFEARTSRKRWIKSFNLIPKRQNIAN